VQDASRGAPLDFGLRQLELGLCERFVARGDREFDSLHIGADPTDPTTVDLCASRIGSDTLFRGYVVRHS
jgi:hypothetical protein